MSDQAKNGDLRIWHIPQVPGTPFRVLVPSVEAGRALLKTLADYDLFQYKHNIKPDYSNAQGLEVFEDGEWLDWEPPEAETQSCVDHPWQPLTMWFGHHRRRCMTCKRIEIFAAAGPRRSRTWVWREATLPENLNWRVASRKACERWLKEKPSLARAMGIKI